MDIFVIDERVQKKTNTILLPLQHNNIIELYDLIVSAIYERTFMEQSLPIQQQRQIAILRVSNEVREWTLQPPVTLADAHRLASTLKTPLSLRQSGANTIELDFIPPFAHSTADILAEVMKVIGSARKLSHCNAFAPVSVSFLSPLIAMDYNMQANTGNSLNSLISPGDDVFSSSEFIATHGDANRLAALLRRMEAGQCVVRFIRPLHTRMHQDTSVSLPLWLSSDVAQLSTRLHAFTRVLAACKDCIASLLRADAPSIHSLLQYDDSTIAPRVLRVLLPIADADSASPPSARYLPLDCLLAPQHKPLPAIGHTSLCHCHGAPLLYTTAAPTTTNRYCSVTQKRLRQTDLMAGLRVGAYSVMLPPAATEEVMAHRMRVEVAQRVVESRASEDAEAVAGASDGYAVSSPASAALALADLVQIRAGVTSGYLLSPPSHSSVGGSSALSSTIAASIADARQASGATDKGHVSMASNVEAMAVVTATMPSAALSVGLLTGDVFACQPLSQCALSVLNGRSYTGLNAAQRTVLSEYTAVQQQGQSALWRALMRELAANKTCLIIDSFEIFNALCEVGGYSQPNQGRFNATNAGKNDDASTAIARLRSVAPDSSINASVNGDVSGIARYGCRQRFALVSDGREAVLLRVPCAEEILSRQRRMAGAEIRDSAAADAAALSAMGISIGGEDRDAAPQLALSSLLATLPVSTHAAASAYSSGAREEVGRVLRASGVAHMGYTVGVRWHGEEAAEETEKKAKKPRKNAAARDDVSAALSSLSVTAASTVSSSAPMPHAPAQNALSPPPSPTTRTSASSSSAAAAPAAFRSFARPQPLPQQQAFAVRFGDNDPIGAKAPPDPKIYVPKNKPALAPVIVAGNVNPNNNSVRISSNTGASLYKRKG